MKISFRIQLLDKMGIAETLNSKPNYVDLINLIRSIQRAEGNLDCYRRGLQQCDQMSCFWRDHCLKATEASSRVDSEAHQHKKAADPKQEQFSLD